MPPDLHSVDHVEITRVVVKISKTEDGYQVALTANGETWQGSGPFICSAIESAIKSVRAEKRVASKGRLNNRCRVASSLG